jgi:hypothetical protein
MREMVREALGLAPDPGSEWATGYGQHNEARAIADYEKARQVLTFRVGQWQETVVHPVHDWLAATPDGLVDENGIVEGKCPRRATYTHIDQRPDYYAQMQIQIGCLSRQWGDFVVWRAPGLPSVYPLISTVHYDPSWLWTSPGPDQPARIDILRAFHTQYLQVMLDDELSAPYRLPLVDERTDPEWAAAATDWLDAKYDAKRAKAAEEEAAAVLVELSGGRKARGFGASVSHSPVKGRIDYGAVIEKYAPDADVEHFRAPSANRATVREVGVR